MVGGGAFVGDAFPRSSRAFWRVYFRSRRKSPPSICTDLPVPNVSHAIENQLADDLHPPFLALSCSSCDSAPVRARSAALAAAPSVFVAAGSGIAKAIEAIVDAGGASLLLRWKATPLPVEQYSRRRRSNRGTTCGQGGMRPGFVTSPGIYRELIGLEQFGRRGPGGDVRFSLHRLSFQRGR